MQTLVDLFRRHLTPLDSGRGVGQILDLIGDVDVVLIGEATHGTHEFYDTRAHITRALVAARGFNVVAVEADWPDAYRASQWARGYRSDDSAQEALGDFIRFPRWMWRNRVVEHFLEWLRDYNLGAPGQRDAAFYGLDLYSLHRSIEAVLRYLDRVDPGAAERARERYACFDMFGADPQTYGHATTTGREASCEPAVVAQLR